MNRRIRSYRGVGAAALGLLAVVASFVAAPATVGAVFTDASAIGAQSIATGSVTELTGGTASRTGSGVADVAWQAPEHADRAEYTVTRTVGDDTVELSPDLSTAGGTTWLGDDLTVALAPEPLVALSSGYGYTCGLADDRAYCWGANDSGQLGDGTTTTRTAPIAVTGLTDRAVTALSAGGSTVCAILDDVEVSCWGSGQAGNLGDGTLDDRPVPGPVLGLPEGSVGAVVVGSSHACAAVDGTAYCWGSNQSGALGNGSGSAFQTRAVPVSGLAGRTVIALETGDGLSTCALLDGGDVSCWGENSFGQLGDGTTILRLAPVAVTGLPAPVVDLGMGTGTTCVALDTGDVSCWGLNYTGQVGQGTATGPVLVPTTVPRIDGHAYSKVDLGYFHACATRDDGLGACWGRNYAGQAAQGGTSEIASPGGIPAFGELEVAEFSGGYEFGCATLSDGSTRCWGANHLAQLGNGTTSSHAVTPAPILRGEIPLGSCRTGWTPIGAERCAPGPGVPVSYEVSYTVGGWSPSTALTLTAPVLQSLAVTRSGWSTLFNLRYFDLSVRNLGAAPARVTVDMILDPPNGSRFMDLAGGNDWSVSENIATRTLAPFVSQPSVRALWTSPVSGESVSYTVTADGYVPHRATVIVP